MFTTEKILRFFSYLSVESIAITIFLFACVLEFLKAKWKNIFIYNPSETIQNIAIGLFGLFTDMAFSISTLPILNHLYTHYRLFVFNPNSAACFIVLFILVDIGEYTFHLLCHKINVLWAAHVVHHQSKTYNLSVGFRTSIFIPIFNIAIYIIYPILGFDPQKVLLIIFIQGMYQICIHTTLIGKLGVLEYLFITPSAHRVHHGCNEEYIDKNFGKVFVLWDKIFGTYQSEKAPIIFGVKNAKTGTGIIRIIFKPYLDLYRKIKHKKIAWKKIIFGKPEDG